MPYEFDPVIPQSDEQKAVQPWGSELAMSNGDVRMYESMAMRNYIYHAFDGLPLQPADALANARCWLWTSVFIQYLYRPAIDIVLQRLIVPARGGERDEALVASSVPRADKAPGILDGGLEGQAHFAGDDALHVAAHVALPEDDAGGRGPARAPRLHRPLAGRHRPARERRRDGPRFRLIV